jgi:SdrD B-like domain
MNSLYPTKWLSRIFFLFILSLQVSFNTVAQTSSQVKFVTPTILSACNMDTICVEVTNLKGMKGVTYAGNVTLEVDVPGGNLVSYVPSSVHSSPAGATEVSYVANKLTMSVPLPLTGRTTKVCFVIRPDCNIASLAGLPRFLGKVTYPAGYPLTTETFRSASVNVGRAELSHSLYAAVQFGIHPTPSFGEQFRVITNIVDGGYGNTNEIYYYTVHDNDFTGVVGYVYAISTAGVYTYTSYIYPVSSTPYGAHQTLRKYKLSGIFLGADATLTPGETVRFDEYMTAPSMCANYTSKIWSEYTCGTGGASCTRPDTLYSNIGIGAGTPMIDGTLISAENPDGCPNKHISFKYKNTGVGNANPTGNAYDTDLKINFGGGLMRISNVKLNGIPVPAANINTTAAASSFTIKLKNFMTTDPDGAGGLSDLDADGFFDDMLVGAETTVDFDYTIPCEEACGTNLYYQLASGATYTDRCGTLAGVSATPLKDFGFQQVQPLEQTKRVDFGVLTTGQSKTDTAKFNFQYKAYNLDLAQAVAQIKIRYSKHMELDLTSIQLNGAPFTNTPVLQGIGAGFGSANPNPNAATDNDSTVVIDLTATELLSLFDASPDKLQYIQTYYGCEDRQNTFTSDNWSLCVKLQSTLCADGSTPCAYDLACKKPFAYSSGNSCGVKPCYISNIHISRENPQGYTAADQTTPIGLPDVKRSYEGDTVLVNHGLFINHDDVQEPNGFYTNQGSPYKDLRTTFSLLYNRPIGWQGNTNIWKFLGNGISTVVVRQRTPDPTDLNLLGTIGAVITEVPLLLEDFGADGGNMSATTQTNYATVQYTYPTPYGSTEGGPGWYCANTPNVWILKDLCPAIDAYRYNAGYNNISYARYQSQSGIKVRDIYYVNIGKALARAGWIGSAGEDNFYFEVKMKWQMDESFPWDNSNSWSVLAQAEHLANYQTVPYGSPGSTYNSSCNNTEDTHLTVTKEHYVANPNAVYNADCGLVASNKVFFKSYEGNYFDNATGEVRVPLKIDSVVIDLPTEYAITPGTISLKYNQACTEQTSTSITASAATGHIVFSNGATDFPRADDCSGNKIAYDLQYTLAKVGTAGPTTYRFPIRIYTRDELGNARILTDSASISEAKPVLTLTPITPVLSNTDGGTCTPAFFDFKIQNNTQYDAPYTFFAAESTTGTTIVNITDHPDSIYPQPILAANISNYGTANKFAKVGTVKAGDIRIIRVYATTNICQDNFTVLANFGCAYPTPLQPDLTSTSLVQTTASYVASTPTLLSSAITTSLNITDLCGEREVEIEVRNANLANLYKMKVGVNLPAGIQYVASSGQVKHPVATGAYEAITTVTSPTANYVLLDLTNNAPFTTACGMTGSDTTRLSTLRVKFRVSFNACPVGSIDELLFDIKGENYCGTQSTSQLVMPIYYVGSAGSQNDYTFSPYSNNLIVCARKNETQAMHDTIWIKNLGGYGTASGASSGRDSVLIVNPINATKMSIANLTVGAPFSSPTFGIDASGNMTIQLLIPAGLAVGDSIALPLNFDLTPRVEKLCLHDTMPLICYFGIFSSPVILECAASGLNCGITAKSLHGTGLTERNFDCCYGSIGDYVWLDTNKDGIQNEVNTGIPNVRVYLIDSLGVRIDSTLTDGTGHYLFTNLFVGSYQVQFIKPVGYVQSPANAVGGTNADNSDADATGTSQVVTLTPMPGSTGLETINPTLDAGYYPCDVAIGSITADTATCVNGVTQTDGKITITGISNGTSYSYGTNGTTGFSPTTATTISGNTITITGLASPTVATTYTFRIYATDTSCYQDYTVVLNPTICLIPCSSPNCLPVRLIRN